MFPFVVTFLFKSCASVHFSGSLLLQFQKNYPQFNSVLLFVPFHYSLTFALALNFTQYRNTHSQFELSAITLSTSFTSNVTITHIVGTQSNKFYVRVTVHRDKFPYNKTN
jgi:hypothetical protein